MMLSADCDKVSDLAKVHKNMYIHSILVQITLSAKAVIAEQKKYPIDLRYRKYDRRARRTVLNSIKSLEKNVPRRPRIWCSR